MTAEQIQEIHALKQYMIVSFGKQRTLVFKENSTWQESDNDQRCMRTSDDSVTSSLFSEASLNWVCPNLPAKYGERAASIVLCNRRVSKSEVSTSKSEKFPVSNIFFKSAATVFGFGGTLSVLRRYDTCARIGRVPSGRQNSNTNGKWLHFLWKNSTWYFDLHTE